MFVPSKAFGIMLGDSWFDLAEKQKLLRPVEEFLNSHKHDKILNFLHEIGIQIAYVVLIFKNFWSYRSIRSFQIVIDCSIFDRFCFLCIVCLFWWLYGFLWWVFAIEKLEYSRYNAKTKYELVWYSTYSRDLFSYTNGSDEAFVEFCVIEVFKFWVILWWMKV